MNFLFDRADKPAPSRAKPLPAAALLSIFPVLCLLFAGCAASEIFPDGRAFVVRRETDFFRCGPAQPAPPEKLAVGAFLDVLRKDPSYCYVKLFDGRTGYVGTDDLSAAPPPVRAVPIDPPKPEPADELPPPDFHEIPEEISGVVPAP
ncbi:MAG: hypothetical protein WCQ16_03915 [Verrucomicrobiae bacterium]